MTSPIEQFVGLDLYHIMLHDREKTKTLDDVEAFVREKLKSIYYLISQENIDTNKHYHILVRTSVNSNDKQNRVLRELVNKFGVKGKGNLSVKLVQNKVQLFKYILKDGGLIRYKGITLKEVELFKKLSTKKGKYKLKNKALELKYMDDPTMSIVQFGFEYVELQLSYGYTMRNQRPYLMSWYLRKNPDKIRDYVKELFKWDELIH